MKRNSFAILSVLIIVILAGALVGVLVYMKNQPAQTRGIAPIVEIAAMEPDSAKWGINFPNQYSTLLKTKDNSAATTYGGSDKYSQLEKDPRQVILFAGNAFSKEYTDDRGHMNSLEDVRSTKRVNEKTPGTCYSCKSSNNPAVWEEMGMAAYDKTPFAELGSKMIEPIGCANCHEAGTMRLIVTNPALKEALEAAGQRLDHLHPPGNAHRGLRQLPCGILLPGRRQIPDLPLG